MKRFHNLLAAIGRRRVAALAILFVATVAVDVSRPQADYAVTRVAYDSSKGPPLEISTPVDSSDRFDLRFDVLANNAAYCDIVQASGGASSSTLRLELQPPQTLVLIPFGIDVAPITLVDGFALNKWHHIEFTGAGDHFSVVIDGTVQRFELAAIHQLQSSAEIGSKDFTFRFKTIDVGSGFLPPRQLPGKIANLSFRARYSIPLPLPLLALGEVSAALAVLWLLLPWLKRIRKPEMTNREIIVLGVLAICTLVAFAAGALGLQNGNWAILLTIGAAALLGAAIAGRVHVSALSHRATALAITALLIASAASLVTLPNSIAIVRMFERWPFASAFCVTFAFCVAALIVDTAARRRTQLRTIPWFAWAPYVLFALFALRTDSIFAPINALHWDYFLGPIRGLREGGWLLWDVPSQYGFLNVLIPALLPIEPVVNAFYWFQAGVLFAAAATFYYTLHVVLGARRFVACALVVAFFFLADPLLVGPTPYPSMSAVRFLWCYILLAIAAINFLGPRPSVKRFARIATAVWIFGVLWSAESAIYTTVMFFAPLVGSLLLHDREHLSQREKLRSAAELVVPPLLWLFGVLVAVEAAYVIGLGHSPDWAMFVAYIRSYGGGFGERSVPIYGPIWTIVFILFGGVVLLSMFRRNAAEGPACAAAAALAAVWIVSSYYLGRAYPVVVTTLSPLLVFALLIIIRAGSVAGKMPVAALTAIPLLALGLASSFWNAEAPELLAKLAVPNVEAWTRLPLANAELTSLLTSTHVGRAMPVVYYDTWVAMPRSADGPFDKNWLPTPLQALENPIPAFMRARIVARFVLRHHMSGYFIQVTTGNNVPESAQAWFSVLSPYYNITEVAHSRNYRLLHFELRNPREIGIYHE